MKLSNIDDLNCLTIEEYNKIIYPPIDEINSGDAIILLGGIKEWCLDRAKACVTLDKIINAKYIITTGGVNVRDKVTEAEFLRQLLIDGGIEPSKIILENQATSTKENMLYTNEILATLPEIKEVIIVTSNFHLRRGLELAKNYLNSKYEIKGYPDQQLSGNKENWYKSEYYTSLVKQEVKYLKSHIKNGYIQEIEF